MVALVAEQTGYPPELLDLDLDLEADLGIDTVKQAELFAQVRESYGIERDESLKLRDYPTLNHVIGFIRDRTPTAVAAAVLRRLSRCRHAAVPPDEDLADGWWRWWPSRPGIRPELLDLDLDLEADLGIDTVKQAELFAQVRESYGIERDESLKCATTRPSTTSSASSATARRPRWRPLPPRRAWCPAGGTARIARRGSGGAGGGVGGRPDRYPPELLDLDWTSKPTSASTPSSRPSCSRRCARATASNATSP